MRVRREGISIGLLGLVALAAVAMPVFAAPPGADAKLRPERVPWRQLGLAGGKFGIELNTRLELELRPAASVVAELSAPKGPPGIQPEGDRVLEIRLDSSFLRRRSELRVWVDPETGTALERLQRDTGSRLRTKTSRYQEGGLGGLRVRPRRGEEELPQERWSDRSEGFDPYPELPGEPPRVSDPAALLYAAAASGIDRVGDAARLVLHADDELVEVEMRAAELRRVEVDYERVLPAGMERIRGAVAALRLVLEARSLAAAGGAREVELAGLRGRLEILLDPATRLPLEISGSVPYAGRVVIRLERAHWR